MGHTFQRSSAAKQIASAWASSLVTQKHRPGILVGVLMLSVLIPLSSYGASFDCAKAKTSAEKFVCGNNDISMLDDELATAYRDVLSKADNDHKKELISEQQHWLRYTRKACTNEICFKHAYWLRLAELKTFYEHKSPLYKKESEKAPAIQKILASYKLYESGASEPMFCRQVIKDLRQMHDITFVDPVVQVKSYESPALDSWKNQCDSEHPLNYDAECDPNIWPVSEKELINKCAAGYGLPLFKIYEIPATNSSEDKTYIFYSDSSYGPMNEDWRKPILGGSMQGFHKFYYPKCDEIADRTFAVSHGTIHDGPNYNSIIEYHKKYYFLMLYKWSKFYWLDIRPIGKNEACTWSPVKRSTR